MEEQKSLTHSTKDHLSEGDIKDRLEEIKASLHKKYNHKPVKLAELNQILEDLKTFELGRFLIYNKGALSGFWTYYIIMGYNTKDIHNKTEKFLLNQSPAICATRERFQKFQELLCNAIKENSIVCSVPCGLMADLTTLKIDKDIKNIEFVGIDLDGEVFEKAKKLIDDSKKPLESFRFLKKNAWKMDETNQFSVLTSNGLNLYEKDDNKVTDLYKGFFKALKPNGLFIGSSLSDPKEWDQDKINQENLKLQKKIFLNILEATWQNYRSHELTQQQLQSAGFKNIKFYWDSQKIFYTFTAEKPDVVNQEPNSTLKLT